MPKEQKKTPLPRQPPVSCRFCRSRKLRCDRKSPCSSCVSRKIPCELETSSNETSTPPVTSDSAVLARLQRLEELLTAEPRQYCFQPKEVASNHSTVAQHVGSDRQTPKLDGLDQDVAWLESMYQHRIPLDKEQLGQFTYQIIGINDLEQTLTMDYASVSNIVGKAQTKRILLPTLHEAKLLLDKYIDDIDFVHHITHTPSLVAAVEEIYASLSNSGQAKVGHVILLLSIIGSASYSWTEMDDKRDLFPSPAHAHIQSSFWIKAGQELLDVVHRSTNSSIEAVQGAIILAFVAVHHEDVPSPFNTMLSMALQMARNLGLHRLDHPSAAADNVKPIYAEVGRRVWWYLVSSDWFLACKFGGPVEGTYQCQPRQMITKKPSNLDDEDLYDDFSPVEKPMSTPTCMSYSLQRLRMAELCRHFVDSDPLVMSGTSFENYDSVLDFDTALQAFINDLPAFFSMSDSEIARRLHFDHAKARRLAAHGHIIHHMVYSLRCKLHVPYLMRGFADPKYATSRQICIKTAQLIIQNEIQHESIARPQHNRYQFIGFVLGVFVASVVLLVELCVDKTNSHQSEYRQEIIDAFRLLEMARGRSRNAARFLDSLLSVLHKHQVAPPKQHDQQQSHDRQGGDQEATTLQISDTRDEVVPAFPTPEGSAPVSEKAFQTNDLNTSVENTLGDGIDMSSYFDMLNTSLQQGSDMEFCDWDGLFSGLGSLI